MILKRVAVRNFRSIRDAAVDLCAQTAIVGGNGAGKSSVLRAIDRFYAQATNIDSDDFFGRQFTESVEIELTFTDFNDTERDNFESRIHSEEMTVVRVFEPGGGKNNGRYYDVTRQHPPFAAIRSMSGATSIRAAYNELRDGGGLYEGLPTVSRVEQVWTVLDEWEARNQNECELARDDGQFFGFTNVARGALQKATSFVFIPAVRDASADALDSRGAVIAKLLELVVRSAIQQRSDVKSFQSRISAEYRELTDPEKLQELSGLSDELSSTLRLFYGDAGVELRWKPSDEFIVPLPSADVLLDDDGFTGPVDRKGHGLQRAFILTLLQHLAKATSADAARQATEKAVAVPADARAVSDNPFSDLDLDDADLLGSQPSPIDAEALPGLILAIEEPELYQHPTKQRHFAKVLSKLSADELPGVARQTQILFATHSALFVSMDRFDEVRLARRVKTDGQEHKECQLTHSTLEQVAQDLENAHEAAPGTYSAKGLKGRLHIFNSEIAEGLFADMVVLVEGAGDRAAILAYASLQGDDLEALGVAVLNVDGKTKLDKPLAIFDSLNIPSFVIWDCDKRADGTVERPAMDRALQLLSGVMPHEVRASPFTAVESYFACFDTKLETVIRDEIGAEAYYAYLAVIRTEYGIDENRDAIKSPFAMSELLRRAAADGLHSVSLGQVVRRIVAMRKGDDASELLEGAA